MAAEMLLQYLWEHRLWPYGSLATTDGRRVDVIDQGRRNTDAGPDFFNAKVRIGGQEWVGNVEIHVRSTDWARHGHTTDRAYDSVVLHAVGKADCDVRRTDGSVIPQVELPYVDDYRSRYDAMVYSSSEPACGSELPSVDPIHMSSWLSALGFERLYEKVDRIETALSRNGGDWQAAAYVVLARALGFSTNGEAFERVAAATPLRCLLKHSNDIQLVESTLFGQAGFLSLEGITDAEEREYMGRMLDDYAFMRAKYSLSAPESPGWRMARMRPANFPHRRIAALAAMIADGFSFGRRFAHVENEEEARRLFDIRLGGYWTDHFRFGQKSVYSPSAFSADTVTSLLINVAVPLLYAYGLHYGNDLTMERAVELLHCLPAENNSLVRIFTGHGIACEDAFTSQAMIHLRRNYCEQRKCLYCRIGHRLLAEKTR